MLRKTMIVLATAAALTGGLTADAFARGGGGHMGGGGGHMGGGFGGHMGGGFGGAPITIPTSPVAIRRTTDVRQPAKNMLCIALAMQSMDDCGDHTQAQAQAFGVSTFV